MAHFDATYELTFNNHPVAEIDVRFVVDATDGQHPIEVMAAEIGTYRSGTRYVDVPEPLRGEMIEWAWSAHRDEIDAAFEEDVIGRREYAREIAHAAE